MTIKLYHLIFAFVFEFWRLRYHSSSTLYSSHPIVIAFHGFNSLQMRHIYIVLDLSSSMNDTDLKPTRMQCVLHQMENFVDRFYDENPISQMAIVATSNKRAEKVINW